METNERRLMDAEHLMAKVARLDKKRMLATGARAKLALAQKQLATTKKAQSIMREIRGESYPPGASCGVLSIIDKTPNGGWHIVCGLLSIVDNEPKNRHIQHVVEGGSFTKIADAKNAVFAHLTLVSYCNSIGYVNRAISQKL